MDLADVDLTLVEDRPKGGMWHCGPNPCWVTATHRPTGIQARSFHRVQWNAREAALMALELLVDEARRLTPSFPERIA